MLDDAQNIQRLTASVNRFSLSLARSRPAAEDLAQESWSRALPVLRDGGHANPEALLIRAARNIWIDGLRRDARKTRVHQLTVFEEAAVDRPLQGMELAPVFASLNKHLPKLQLTVFLMRDVLGYSIRETADALATTEGAVKAAHHRCRRALADVRREWAREDGPPLPADESERIEAHLMADAYARGDVGTLVALANGETRAAARQLPVRASARRSPGMHGPSRTEASLWGACAIAA